ncbi:hypothetical protein B0J17DRAFT_627442 [Rhizoctonia solani]|nr:hypothetical protein B0J17DRAFT_627442 [Rhizoctonia solani]
MAINLEEFPVSSDQVGMEVLMSGAYHMIEILPEVRADRGDGPVHLHIGQRMGRFVSELLGINKRLCKLLLRHGHMGFLGGVYRSRVPSLRNVYTETRVLATSNLHFRHILGSSFSHSCKKPYESVFIRLEETKENKMVPPRRVCEALVRRCVEKGDPRAELALEDMEICGYCVLPELRDYLLNKEKKQDMLIDGT